MVRELTKVPIDRGEPYVRESSAQDTLEFAAMLLKLKPIFLLGRGFDDPTWVSAVKGIASRLRVPMIESAIWNVDYSKLEVPPWYRALRETAGETATYMSADPSAITEVRKISARGWVSPAEEARLLGYPLCCVEERHKNSFVVAECLFRAAMGAAKGDEAKAREMILADVEFAPEGEDAKRMSLAVRFWSCKPRSTSLLSFSIALRRTCLPTVRFLPYHKFPAAVRLQSCSSDEI